MPTGLQEILALLIVLASVASKVSVTRSRSKRLSARSRKAASKGSCGDNCASAQNKDSGETTIHFYRKNDD